MAGSPANALNITLAGLVKFDGINQFSAATVTQHDVLIGGSSNSIISVAPGISGTILQSTGASSDPSFSTATYPSTISANLLLYASAANTIGGLATANNGILITGTTGVPSILSDGTTGQVLTATTGSPPSWANVAASSISITGDTGGALTGAAFTFTGGTTGLSFGGSGSTETVSGTLVLANGGTNANLTASNGGIFYSTASAGAILAGTATANQVLLSGSSTTPAWSTATYPATTTINQILYSSSANVIGGIATANNGVMIANNSGVPSMLANGTAGYVLTANTAAPPSWQAAAGGIPTIGSSTNLAIATWNGTTGSALYNNTGWTINAQNTGQMLAPAGSLNNPSYSFSSATGFGISYVSSKLYLVAGQNPAITIDQNELTTVNGYVVFNNGLKLEHTTTNTNLTVGLTNTIFGLTDTSSPRTVTLPSSGTNLQEGSIFIVKDQSGGAGTNNITVSVNGGTKTIDGVTSYVMNVNYASATFYYDGTNYFII